MKLLELPDDILRHIFFFLEFKDLPPAIATRKILGIHFKSACWVLFHGQYTPFTFGSSRCNQPHGISITGRVYSPSYQEWVNYYHVCDSPWEYITMFRKEATADMAPRVVIHDDPRINVTYQGRRSSPRRLVFQQDLEVDVMDTLGIWWKGSMVECKENLIRYHFQGWESRWDQWYPNDSLHVAPLYSITQDWLSALRIGDSVDVKKDRHWFSGVLCEIMATTVLVNVNHEMEVIELPTERLMFHGAHTYTYNTPSFCAKNPVWRDTKGVDVYQYRMRNTTFLTDRVLSDTEIGHHRLEK